MPGTAAEAGCCRHGNTYLRVRHLLEMLVEGKQVRIVGLIVGLMHVPAEPRVHVSEVQDVHVGLKARESRRDCRSRRGAQLRRTHRRRRSVGAAPAVLVRDGNSRSKCQQRGDAYQSKPARHSKTNFRSWISCEPQGNSTAPKMSLVHQETWVRHGTNGIGISDHQNRYSNGVRVANWVENECGDVLKVCCGSKVNVFCAIACSVLLWPVLTHLGCPVAD